MWVMRSSFKLGNVISMETLTKVDCVKYMVSLYLHFEQNIYGMFSYHVNYRTQFNFYPPRRPVTVESLIRIQNVPVTSSVVARKETVIGTCR